MGEVVDRYTIEKVAEATNLSDLLETETKIRIGKYHKNYFRQQWKK